MKRFSALFFAVLMILTLVGCGKQKRQIIELTLSTEDAEAILRAAGVTLPDVESTPAAGKNIKLLSFYDEFHNYNENEVINTGFFTFKEKYGCDIDWVETSWGERMNDLANLVLAGDAPDFFPFETSLFPSGVMKGWIQPVDDYVDYNDPLWAGMRDYVYDYFSLAGRPYVICTDSDFGNVVLYNRRVLNEWGFDDPADLFLNDEWTWSTFYDMCMDFSDPDADRFALDGWYYPHGIIHSSGFTAVSYDPVKEKFVSNVDEPALERAQTLLYDLVKNECTFPIAERGWKTRNENNGGGMKEGLMLFYITGVWDFRGTVDSISAVYGDVTEGELMFVPMPRDSSGDGKYYMESSPKGYSIIKGARTPEGVALLAACERFKVLDPTVISIDERQLKETYYWTDEMLDMYDTCYELANANETAIIAYGDGLGSPLTTFVGNFEDQGFARDISSWAQIKENNRDNLEFYIEELNQTIADYDS